MRCEYCENEPIYRCNNCGKLVCGEHARFRITCFSCATHTAFKYDIKKVKTDTERKKIRELVQQFWGEEEQLTFDRRFRVAELPTYIAKVRDQIVGFVSFLDINDDSTVIAALGILPKYQNSGIGTKLLTKVETEAMKKQKKKLLVSTSNDDFPALAFYQSLGFQIYEAKPNVIAEKHGKIVRGIGGLPVRDELRLQKSLT
jgi:ribosomal protein S18 acetylase RimI-like enzyme